jgi:hypothetical protein
MMLRVIDIAFVIFHTALIVFNVAGWALPRLRLANLVTLALTGLSWFGLGIFYGLGYCPFTDWHFSVLRRLGETDLPRSYVEYLIERFLPVDVSAALVDTTLLVGFLLALAISLVLNVRDFRRRRAGR